MICDTRCKLSRPGNADQRAWAAAHGCSADGHRDGRHRRCGWQRRARVPEVFFELLRYRQKTSEDEPQMARMVSVETRRRWKHRTPLQLAEVQGRTLPSLRRQQRREANGERWLFSSSWLAWLGNKLKTKLALLLASTTSSTLHRRPPIRTFEPQNSRKFCKQVSCARATI